MPHVRATPVLGVIVILTAGCSGKSSSPASDGATATDWGAAEQPDAPVDEPEVAAEISRCGDIIDPYTPSPGGICASPGRVCSCYDDLRADCRTQLLCEGVNWKERRASCPPPAETTCPDSVDQARGQPCAPRLADCNYPGQGHCFCLTPTDPSGGVPDVCSGPSTPVWFCGYAAEGCPQGIPDVGTPCREDGVRCGNPCVWLSGGLRLDRQCIDGTWQLAPYNVECV